MSDQDLGPIAIIFLLAIVFLSMVLGILIGYKLSVPEARCERMGEEYSYAADVCFKNGEEV